MQSIHIKTGSGLPLPDGFEAAGVHCGVKPQLPDLALFHSRELSVVAGVFTTNRCAAACVQQGRRRLAARRGRAIVVNSGNANACTGEPGRADAETMAESVAARLGILPQQVYMSSTGPIGRRLPMDAINRGIAAAAEQLSPRGLDDAARAMMTTDTWPKTATARMDVDGRLARLTGVAKGAGMIQPNMATMLAYLFTDADVQPAAIQQALNHAVARSFNRITVDGDQSTNDSVLLFANGLAGNDPLGPSHPAWPSFLEALTQVARSLARQIVADGEGATRLVTIRVEGGASDADAERIARAIGNSLLIKTSWAGGDPNWGRIVCAVGYAGAVVDPNRLDVYYDDVPAAECGMAAATAPGRLAQIAAQEAFTLRIALHQGPGQAELIACDTTEAYVRINVEE